MSLSWPRLLYITLFLASLGCGLYLATTTRTQNMASSTSTSTLPQLYRERRIIINDTIIIILTVQGEAGPCGQYVSPAPRQAGGGLCTAGAGL